LQGISNNSISSKIMRVTNSRIYMMKKHEETDAAVDDMDENCVVLARGVLLSAVDIHIMDTSTE
jgi:hypothetical protein